VKSRDTAVKIDPSPLVRVYADESGLTWPLRGRKIGRDGVLTETDGKSEDAAMLGEAGGDEVSRRRDDSHRHPVQWCSN
jgi:hypothetical protein